MEFEFHGLEELIMALERAGDNIEEGKKEALEKAGKKLHEATVQAAKPRWRTGNLERHIELSDVMDDEIHVHIDQQGPAYYGYMLEEGTSKMPAYPFMFPAFMSSRYVLQQIMAKTLSERLRSLS